MNRKPECELGKLKRCLLDLDMLHIRQLAIALVLAYFATACSKKDEDSYYIRQSVPIQVQKTVDVRIHDLRKSTSYPGGIRCPPEIWKELTNTPASVRVSLVSSDSPAEVHETEPDSNYSGVRISDFHCLFWISGSGDATIRIAFAFTNLPQEHTNVEIVIGRSPQESL